MTEQIKSAISELELDMECGEFYNPSMADSVKLSIRSLKAWEEVLQELEEQLHTGKDSNWKNATINAICIIKQKLSEIEEEK